MKIYKHKTEIFICSVCTNVMIVSFQKLEEAEGLIYNSIILFDKKWDNLFYLLLKK